MGNLLLLNLAGKEGLCLLDTGPDPGLALVGPVGAQPKANLRQSLLQAPGQTETPQWAGKGWRSQKQTSGTEIMI